MEYRILGRANLSVSAICLGTMTFGEQNTQDEAFAQMDLAVDRGVNFFDAAELYPIPPRAETAGRTEQIIGAWLQARGGRDRVIVATKAVGRSTNTYFRRAGIPALSSRRDDRFPLVLGGGVCAWLNPEPLADIVDLFAVGERSEEHTSELQSH